MSDVSLVSIYSSGLTAGTEQSLGSRYPVVYIVSKFLAPRPATICLAYPLVYWKPSPASPESGATGSHSIISGSHGGMSLELAGLSEQVWLASVEEPLRAAVKKTRRRSSEAEKIL